MDIQAVIFDMDGLILDTERVYSEGWQNGARQNGVELPAGFVEEAAGNSVDHNVATLKKAGLDVALIQKIRTAREDYFYQQLDDDQIPIKPGFVQLMTFLKEQGIKTGLATSSYKERVRRIMAHYNFTPYFDALVVGDEVSEVKPQPEIYLKALEHLQADKKKALVLEDSVVGGWAASRAGVQFILVPDQSALQPPEIPPNFPHLVGVKDSLATVVDWLQAQK